jgi:YD repeat-containing protein
MRACATALAASVGPTDLQANLDYFQQFERPEYTRTVNLTLRAAVSLAYDLRGQLRTLTEDTGLAARVTTFSYDGLHRLVRVTDPLGHSVVLPTIRPTGW